MMIPRHQQSEARPGSLLKSARHTCSDGAAKSGAGRACQLAFWDCPRVRAPGALHQVNRTTPWHRRLCADLCLRHLTWAPQPMGANTPAAGGAFLACMSVTDGDEPLERANGRCLLALV